MAPKRLPKSKADASEATELPSSHVSQSLENKQVEKCVGSSTYPVTIPLNDLDDALRKAYWSKQPVLVCAGGRREVEGYLSYQTVSMYDCKKAAIEVAITKEKTLEQARSDFRQAVVTAIRGNPAFGEGCFPRPLWLRFGNSAFALANLDDSDNSLVVRVLKKGYSVDDAYADGLISEAEKLNLESSDRFKENFGVCITSEFDAEEAQEHLIDSIPNFHGLGLIMVEPPLPSGAQVSQVARKQASGKSSVGRASMYEHLPEALQEKIQAALVSGNQEELAAALKIARDLHRG